MAVLVFGRGGQLGRALQDAAPVLALGRDAADLGDPESCAAAIRHHAPEAVINAAAWTAVDAAEAEEDAARVANAAAPGAMARACAALRIPLVHISTDYVFPGTGTAPWQPEDPVAPVNAYGRGKLAGEAAVRAAGGVHAILRTSWVISGSGRNFVTAMLGAGARHARLRVVADQVGGPTPAASLAAACLSVADTLRRKPELTGTYHFAGAPDVSWAALARAIFAAAEMAVDVEEIGSADWPAPAARPANSRLDCRATERAFGLVRPDWRAALPAMVAAARHSSGGAT